MIGSTVGRRAEKRCSSTTGELPAKLMRLDYETGKREFVREVAPTDRAGVNSSFGIVVTPDAKAYAYNPSQMLHECTWWRG
jgi:hypothetical protein